MRKRTSRLQPFVLAAAALLLAVPAVHATPITYITDLSGPNESPPNASPGTGNAIVTLDTTAHTLDIAVTFSGLLGNTTASHIHCCTALPDTGTAGVATATPTFPGFPLGVTSGTYSQRFDTTLASTYNPAFVTAHGDVTGAEAALATGLSEGRAYFNIHTNVFTGGEIRGFLAVPEPESFALMGIGLAGMGISARRRKVGE